MSKSSHITVVGNWYRIRELKHNLFEVHEPDHVSFFVFRDKDKALFIDSGLGLDDKLAKKLLAALKIKEFSVLNTHAHCDHVGLNYLAKDVYLYKPEWLKYIKQNEKIGTAMYHDLLRDLLTWPKKFKKDPNHEPFKPTKFINLNQRIKFGDWSFKPYKMPGHTKGSLIFYEESMNLLFLGDFIYNGILYVNLDDSSIFEFEKSFERLYNLIKVSKEKPMLLPCHNDIPLDVGYAYRLHLFLTQIKNGKIKHRGRWPFGRFFLPSKVFTREDTRIVIRNDQIKKWVKT